MKAADWETDWETDWAKDLEEGYVICVVHVAVDHHPFYQHDYLVAEAICRSEGQDT